MHVCRQTHQNFILPSDGRIVEIRNEVALDRSIFAGFGDDGNALMDNTASEKLPTTEKGSCTM
jgi:hypothetical protein